MRNRTDGLGSVRGVIGGVGAVLLLLAGLAPRAHAQSDPAAKFGRDDDGALRVEAPGFDLRIDAAGAVRLDARRSERGPDPAVHFVLVDVHQGSSVVALATGAVSNDAPRIVSIDRGAGVTERYESRRMGVEQMFVLQHSPGGHGDIILVGRFDTEAEASQARADGEIHFSQDGEEFLSYGEATAVDADGRTTPCRMQLTGKVVQISVPEEWAAAAKWPVTIDPLVGSLVTASGSTSLAHRRLDLAYSVTSNKYLVVCEAIAVATTTPANIEAYFASGVSGSASPTTSPTAGSSTILTTVSGSATANETTPAVAWIGGTDDKFLVAWINKSTNEIRGAITSATVTTAVFTQLSTPIAVTSAAEPQITRVRVGGRRDGGSWLVVYDVIDTFKNGSVRGVLVSATGVVGAPVDLSDPTFFDQPEHGVNVNRLADAGQPWFTVWTYDFDATPGVADFDTVGTLVDPSGNLGFLDFLASSGAIEEDASIDGFGPTWVLAWDVRTESTGDRDVQACTLDSGLNLGPRVNIATGTADDTGPCVSALPNDIMITWNRFATTGSATVNLRYSRFTTDLTSIRESQVAVTTDNLSRDAVAAGRAVTNNVSAADYIVGWARLFGTTDFDPRIQHVHGDLDPTMVVRESTITGTILTNNVAAAAARSMGRRDPAAGPGNSVTIVIQNTGGANLILTAPSLTNTADFVLNTTNFTTTVAPNANTTFSATFDPASSGIKTSQITFNFSGGALPVTAFNINLTGEGVNGLLTVTSATATPIPDAVSGTVPGTVTSTVSVSTTGNLGAIRISNLNITHGFNADLDIFLVAPNGVRVELATELTGFSGHINTTFDQSAATLITAGTSPYTGIFRPKGNLDSLLGMSVTGVWGLEVSDDDPVGTGTLTSWTLELVVLQGAATAVREGSATGTTIANGSAPADGRNFGFGVPGQPSLPVSVFVVNAGVANLNITTPPSSSSADFTVDSTGTQLSGILAGASTSFTVRFTPQSTGVKTGTISFGHDGTNTGTPFTFQVTGEALAITPTAASFASTNPPLLIPDNVPAGVSSTVFCDLGGTVLSVSVSAVNVDHGFTGDVEIKLISPDGRVLMLCDNRGGTGDNFVNTAFDDQAAIPIASGAAPFTGSFRPEQAFSTLRAATVTARGFWTLNVCDNAAIIDGVFKSWTLNIVSTDPRIPTGLLTVREGGATGTVLTSGATVGGARNMGAMGVSDGPAAPLTITLQNTGSGPINVTTLAQISGDPDFTVTPATFTATPVPGNGSSSFQVVFDPQALGTRTASFQFTHDGFTGASPFVINVQGEGVAALPVTSTSTDVPKLIPDDDSTGIVVVLPVNKSGFVVDVKARVTITHPFTDDLRLDLTAPDGTTIRLADEIGVTGANYTDTVFTDSASTPIDGGTAPYTGSFRPEAPLGTFTGKAAQGLWKLSVADVVAIGTGNVNVFELEISVTSTPTPLIEVRDVSVTGTAIVSGSAPSGQRSFGLFAIGGTSPEITMVVRNPGFANLVLPAAPSSSSGDFTVDATGYPAFIPPQGSASFKVRFTPTTAGVKTGTITIQNSAASGNFTFDVTGQALSQPPTFVAYTTTGLSLPVLDNVPAGVSSTVFCDQGGTVLSVSVSAVNVTHGFTGDVEIKLIAPDGTVIMLCDNRGGSGDNFVNTVFDDQAATPIASGAAPYTGSFRPEQPLSTLNGITARGVWTLNVCDNAGGIAGTFTGWTLNILSTDPRLPTPLLRVVEVTTGSVLTDNDPASRARNFGQVLVGSSGVPVTVTVQNVGTGDMNLSGLGLASGAADFSFSTTAFNGVVPSGTSRSFQLAFTPTSTGQKAGTFSFAHDAFGTASPFRVNVLGEGVSALGPTFTSTDVPQTIPDNVAAGIDALLNVGVTGFITDVNVTVDIAHAFIGDVQIDLVAPDGTTVRLATRRGGSGDDMAATVFDDAATTAISAGVAPFFGSFKPESPLAALVNHSPTGVWRLHVADVASGTGGTLLGFKLEITTAQTQTPVFELREGSATGAVIANGAAASGTGRDLGQYIVGNPNPPVATIFVGNAGPVAFNISTPPVSSSTDFTVDLTGFPAAIAPSASATFQVRFTPSTPGVKTGNISFPHNGFGSPFSFQMRGEGLAQPPSTGTFTASNLNLAIPDNNPVGVSSTVTCFQGGTVINVQIKNMNIPHTFVSDLDIFLIHPDGTQVELYSTTSTIGTPDNFTNTSFSDAAPTGILSSAPPYTGTFKPTGVGGLAVLNGKPAFGSWTLFVRDMVGIDTGTLQSWTLQVTSTDPPTPSVEVSEGSLTGPRISNGAGSVIGFGNASIGGTPAGPKTFFIKNSSTQPLVLTQTPVLVGAAPNDFVLSATGFPATLGQNQSVSFTAAFTPTGGGLRAATVSFPHNAPAFTTTPFTFDLRGRGVASVTTVAGTGTPVAVPDMSAGGVPGIVTSTAVVTTAGTLATVVVTVNVNHNSIGDVSLILTHPDGTQVLLVANEGASDDNFVNTVFDDDAPVSIVGQAAPFTGRFRPEGPGGLNALLNKVAAGTWSLTARDDSNGISGTLVSWSLEIGINPVPAIQVRDNSPTGATLTSGAAASGGFAFADRVVTGGTSASNAIVIRSVGNASLDLSSLSITGSNAFTLNPSGFGSGVVPAGQDFNVSVVFDPTVVPAAQINTVLSATVSFAHTDPAVTSPFVVRVTGRATQGVIEVTSNSTAFSSGDTVGFGPQAINGGSAPARSITIRNTGLATVALSTAATITGSADFTVGTLPATLAPNATATLTFGFDPSSAGNKSAVVTFTHAGLSTGAPSPFTVNLTGLGANQIVRNGGGGGGSGGSGGGGGGCSAGSAADTSTPVIFAALLALYAARRARRTRLVAVRA